MDINNRDKELWWKPAVMMFTNISGWIAGPIIIALILGKFLDKKYETDPWFFLGLTGLAFFFSIFGILKILMKYLKEIEKEANEKKKISEGNQNINK